MAKRLAAAALLAALAFDARASPRVLTTELPVGYLGKPYAADLAAADGAPPYTWKVPTSLPRGLRLDGARIAGTPEEITDYQPLSFMAEVTDAQGQSAVGYPSIVILAQEDLALAERPLPPCGFDRTFGFYWQLSGGTPPIEWRSFGLPRSVECREHDSYWLRCEGWVEQQGLFAVSVSARDALGASVGSEFDLACIGDPPVLGPARLPCASLGTAYSVQLTSNYGPLAWSVVAGSLPPGLKMDGSGAIAGVPGGEDNLAYEFGVRGSHPEAGSSERRLAILVLDSHTGCTRGPDPEDPGTWAGGDGGIQWAGGGMGGGPGPGTGGAGASGPGTGAGGDARLDGHAADAAKRGCDCDAAGGTGLLLGAAAAAVARVRRRGRR